MTLCDSCRYFVSCLDAETGTNWCPAYENDGSDGVEGDEDYENDWDVPGSELDEYETTGAGDQV